MSSNNNDYSHLKELGKSNYEVADGESDIRNWVVKNEAGNILGEVDDLVFDSTARKVVFIILNLDKNELNLKERKVLLPVEYAEIHEAYKNVIYKRLMPNVIALLPNYEKGKFTRNSIDLTRTTFLSVMSNESSRQVQPDSHQTSNESGGRNQDKYTAAEQSYSEHQRSGDNLLKRDHDLHHEGNHTTDNSNSYTIIGVFEHARQTQAVMEYLLEHGYNKNDIRITTRQPGQEGSNADISGISRFFKSVFNNDADVKRYSDATDHNYVISVDTSSVHQAEEAANILDQHGSLNMKSLPHAEGETTGNSRVFRRHPAMT